METLGQKDNDVSKHLLKYTSTRLGHSAVCYLLLVSMSKERLMTNDYKECVL